MVKTAQIRRVWGILVGVQQRIGDANLSLVAAGGAFFSMLSVFPGIAAVIAILGFFVDPATAQDQLNLFRDFVPPEAFAILQDQVQRMVSTSSSTLGWATAVSLLAALWSARQGTDALIRGVNAAYKGRARGGLAAALLSFTLTLALSLIAVVALLALVVVPVFSTILSLPMLYGLVPQGVRDLADGFVLWALRWVIALLVTQAGIWLLYRYAPNRPRRLVGLITPGSVLAIVVWALFTVGFSYYLGHFASYSKVYGSIAAVIALLMFLYITIFTVLLGAALNAELEPDAGTQTAPAEGAGAAEPVEHVGGEG